MPGAAPLVGPVLHFRGQQGHLWRLAVLVASESPAPPGPLTLPDGPPVPAALLAVRQGYHFWRYDFALPLLDRPSAVPYALAGRAWRVHLPAAEGGRRLAYTACSGTDAEENGPVPPSRNVLWRQLAHQHARRPFHFLLQGGDQLYADTLWEKVPELGAWRRLSWREANAHAFTPAMKAGAERYYFARYRWVWSQAEIAPLLAAIPSLMMWDDHDIFDGWGSWPDDRQRCPVFQGVIAIARDQFALFQLGARADDLPEGYADPRGGQFGWAFEAGSLGILAPDLRSERSRAWIMGEAGRRGVAAALDRLAGCRHLLVMSSVPLVNADLSAVERVFVALPGHSDLEDDLRDQWQSFAHREEWRAMLRRLLAFARQTGARVTSLAGEIHLGALGLVEGAEAGDERAVLHELTSSGIVHPPPPALLAAAYEWAARRPLRLAADLTVRLLEIPGHGRRYLRARNWLALDLGADGALLGVWHAEAGEAGRLALDPDAGGAPR